MRVWLLLCFPKYTLAVTVHSKPCIQSRHFWSNLFVKTLLLLQTRSEAASNSNCKSTNAHISSHSQRGPLSLYCLILLAHMFLDTANPLSQSLQTAASTKVGPVSILRVVRERVVPAGLATVSLHFNGTLFIFELVFLQRLLDAVAWLAFALDVVLVILHPGPSLVCPSAGVEVGHHVFALLVLVEVAVAIHLAWSVGGNAVEWTMALNGVDDLFSGRGLECLGIGVGYSVERRVL
jgi:hypothetical protein